MAEGQIGGEIAGRDPGELKERSRRKETLPVVEEGRGRIALAYVLYATAALL